MVSIIWIWDEMDRGIKAPRRIMVQPFLVTVRSIIPQDSIHCCNCRQNLDHILNSPKVLGIYR